MRLIASALASALAIVIFAAPAMAQDANDAAAAEALFEEGRQLMNKGRIDEACAKFAASQRLDPAGGTLLNLGECYLKAGKTASAWATFREAEAAAHRMKRPDREMFARQRAADLEPQLVRLTILVPPENRIAGLVIKRDGETIDPATYGMPIPIDPGSHKIQIEAPLKKPMQRAIEISKDDTLTIDALDDLPATEKPIAPAPVVAQPVIIALPPDNGGLNTQRIVGLTIGGVGVVSLAVSGILGLVAIGKNNEAKQAGCDDTSCPTQAGIDLNNQAISFAHASTVMLILGGGMFVAGGVMALTARSKSARKPSIAFTPTGFVGTF